MQCCLRQRTVLPARMAHPYTLMSTPGVSCDVYAVSNARTSWEHDQIACTHSCVRTGTITHAAVSGTRACAHCVV